MADVKPIQVTIDKEMRAIIEAQRDEIAALKAERYAVKRWIADKVEPTRMLAMEISLKYEPCGYYCDERVGHVDHKLFNWAKHMYGSGTEDYIPADLIPGASTDAERAAATGDEPGGEG